MHRNYFFSFSAVFELSEAQQNIKSFSKFRQSKSTALKGLICSLLQAKHLIIIQEKDDWVKMVLSYRLQQNENIELHMI